MLLDDVATYLAANSTHFTVGAAGDLMKAVMLDDGGVPDTVVVLYETGGVGTVHTLSTSGLAARQYEQPALQVLSRSTAYQTARNRAEAAFRLLDGYTGGLPTSTGTTYLSVAAQQSPFSVGRDSNQRYLVSTNYLIRKESS